MTKTTREREKKANENVLNFALLISVLIMIVGLLFYYFLVDYKAPNNNDLCTKTTRWSNYNDISVTLSSINNVSLSEPITLEKNEYIELKIVKRCKPE